jgi:SAM-dependent methyltransferase
VSSNLCHKRSTCRLCGAQSLELVLGLVPTPPANAFVTKDALGHAQETFPLDVFFCQECAHVQLLDIVDPSHLFENYVYVSGTSPVFVKHFETYAKDVTDRFIGDISNKLVVDIGSNDGTLLSQFKKLGLNVLGIDPARDIARDASARGIETMAEFFTSSLAAEIKTSHGFAQVICANNVFAHADGLIDIICGVRHLLSPDGVFVFEVSYLVDVFEKTLFDTIYHEHLAYHSVAPLVRFFDKCGLELISAERVDSHGGSIRGVAQLKSGPHDVDASVDECVAEEIGLGLDKADTLRQFAAKIDACKQKLVNLLTDQKNLGKSIVAFGAPAKATTLMYHFGIDADVIDYIVDDSPLKQGMYSPGMHIPVLPSATIYEKKPDVIVILAWNFADPIMTNHSQYIEAGGTFIVPLPDIEVFGALATAS